MTAYALPFSSEAAGVAGLLFFFAFFTLMTLWVFRPGAKGKYQSDAQIPFKDQEP